MSDTFAWGAHLSDTGSPVHRATTPFFLNFCLPLPCSWACAEGWGVRHFFARNGVVARCSADLVADTFGRALCGCVRVPAVIQQITAIARRDAVLLPFVSYAVWLIAARGRCPVLHVWGRNGATARCSGHDVSYVPYDSAACAGASGGSRAASGTPASMIHSRIWRCWLRMAAATSSGDAPALLAAVRIRMAGRVA